MKAIIFLLVLANLLFFAFTEGYFGRPDNPDAGRAEHQVNPEKIRIVARGEPPAAGGLAKGKAEEAAPVAETANGEKAVPAEGGKKAEAAAEPARSCLAWTNLSSADADRLSALLAEKFDHFRQSRRLVASEGSGWWVFIPPQANKAEAEKKAGELKGLGVSDYFIIQDAGPNRYAVSLGVFSAENGARERLAELKGKGVKSARAGPRPGKDAVHVLEASGPEPAVPALREAIARVLPRLVAQECP